MIDVSEKEKVLRIARAVGKLKVGRESLERIKKGKVEKGDIFEVAKLGAHKGVKATPDLIFMCHPISITSVDVDVKVDSEIKVEVIVKAIDRTGVEMEALSGVVNALLNIWDYLKKYEKRDGQYPETEIYGIKVVEKRKINLN